MLIPSLVLQRTHSTGGMDPQSGYSMLLDVQGAKEGVLSTVDFARVMGQLKGLHTVFERHRFLGRIALGAVATNDFASIPPSLRFFAGGDQSIRGYDYQSLSPVDSTGETIGARYLMASSAEYQYEFIHNWRAATFVDHGNAVDSLTDPRKPAWVSASAGRRPSVPSALIWHAHCRTRTWVSRFTFRWGLSCDAVSA